MYKGYYFLRLEVPIVNSSLYARGEYAQATST